MLGKQPAHEGRFRVVADSSDQPNLGPERPQHGRHTRSPTQPVLTLVGSQERNGSLLADPFGVPPDVAIQDQVTHDHHARAPQLLHAPNQIVRHAGILPDLNST